MREIIENLLKKENIRKNLSDLRKLIKEEPALEEAKELLADKKELLISFLKSDDAKTRKNAALLIGDLGMSEVSDELFKAYENEDTRFVKGSYLAALSQLDIPQLVPAIENHQKLLEETKITDENRKHIEEELKEINKILIKYNGIKYHTPVLEGVKAEVLLMTNRLHREIVRRQIPFKDTKIHPLGVLVKTDNIKLLMQIRTYRQMYFTLHTDGFLVSDPRAAAEQLWKSDMYDILIRMHREKDPFYYRIESTADGEYQGKVARALDQLAGGKLINSPNEYEIVIKLIPTKDGKFFPCMRLGSIKDERFAYRKNVVSTSIHPSTAALLVELAKPYLKEDAQIMDPFCGVGTMLIERKLAVPAREIYATDTFGDAIIMGRENAKLAKTGINFIHRDFFDFKHDYKFDEIITDMPVRGRKTRQEMEEFYERFFDKAKEILAQDGIIVMYSNEIGFVKKQLRLRDEYRLLQETCILDKKDFYLFVIGYEK